MPKCIKDFEEEIVNDYNKGMSNKELGEKYGFNPTSISRFLIRNGHKKVNQSTMSDEDINKVKELLDKGYSRVQIAEELKRNKETIRFVIGYLNGTIIETMPKDVLEKAIEYRKNKMSMAEISKKLSIEKTKLSWILRYKNVNVKRVFTIYDDVEINENFFDVIGEEQMHVLGILFSMGRSVVKFHGRGYFEFKCLSEETSILMSALNKFVVNPINYLHPIPNTKYLSFKVYNEKLCNVFGEWGIGKKLPKVEEQHEHVFFNGYFKKSAYPSNKYIRISSNNIDTGTLDDYLEKHGINTRVKKGRNGASIEDFLSYKNLMKIYPEMEKKILFKSKQENGEYWRKYLKKTI